MCKKPGVDPLKSQKIFPKTPLFTGGDVRYFISRFRPVSRREKTKGGTADAEKT
jgi:hypothetical protein